MLPRVTVQFDGGEPFEVQVLSRDLAVAERDGIVAPDARGWARTYGFTLVALGRMQRQGLLPQGTVLPASADALMDVAELTPEDDDPKEPDPAPSPGS